MTDHTTENDWLSTVDLSAFCERGPCWLSGGHEGPCEPGSRLDPRRHPSTSPE